MTIRNVSEELSRALEQEKRRRGLSLNRTVLQIIEQSLGVGSADRPSNGIARLAGSWSEEDLRQFELAVAPFEEIDDELWR